MANADLRTEPAGSDRDEAAESEADAWRINIGDLRVPEGLDDQPFIARVFRRSHGKKKKIAKYYKKQESLLKGFTEMESINELGFLEGAPTEEDLKQLAKSERMAINISNFVNLLLFISKVLASVESKSLAVIASTLDSLLDLLSGVILWVTAYAMKNPNKYNYPIGKKRMQPVGIIVFASVMGTLGLQVLIESGRQLITKSHTTFDRTKEFGWSAAWPQSRS
uniref:Cation efflux protein transmembrane domain-containing protein n=1 Tax=Ananas comosus var. bracteatus TaxID=296719 RepID=A0A6V7QHC8_ANACO|nr:unnamed protein product [Ananas comosus var. bracteatus]